MMKGSELLIDTVLKKGIEVCFANPGTTEMPLVQAMDTLPGMRPYLGLFEGVCTGAADGYGRMTGKPAMVLLHLGPGLANGIANLHNARRAGTPILTVVGEHATWHREYDPPLAMDIEALARTVSGWQKTVARPEDIPKDTAEAIGASLSGRIATLIVPFDCQYGEAEAGEASFSPPQGAPVDEEAVVRAARLLSGGGRVLLLLGGRALYREGLLLAARIQAKTGCGLRGERSPARMERGAGLPDVPRVPYLPEMAMESLAGYDAYVLAGARVPVSFFGYKNIPPVLVDETREICTLAGEDGDPVAALGQLAEVLASPASPPGNLLSRAETFSIPGGRLTPDKICTALAALQPEDAIVVDESITTGVMYHAVSGGSKPFTLLTLTGGALGQGIPAAAGAAIACPDRQVISFQADGAALYTLQALATQARENLNVVTLIASNRRYDILRYELMRLGIIAPGPDAGKLTELGAIDWVSLGTGLGVPAVCVETAESLAHELENAFREKGPRLIEMRIP